MGRKKDYSNITLESLEAELKTRLPNEIRHLYETGQDAAKCESDPFRLMPLEEVKVIVHDPIRGQAA